MRPEESRTETKPEAELADLLNRLARLLSSPRSCCNHTPEPDRAVRLEEAASLLAMSEDFVYRNWKRLGGYKSPRWVDFVAELPKTATGKIQRFALRQR